MKTEGGVKVGAVEATGEGAPASFGFGCCSGKIVISRHSQTLPELDTGVNWMRSEALVAMIGLLSNGRNMPSKLGAPKGFLDHYRNHVLPFLLTYCALEDAVLTYWGLDS